MTKKHFIALALHIASVRPVEASSHFPMWRATMLAVCDACRQANPAFDKQRFITACFA